MTKHCTRPCADCPFARATTPGDLGGAPVSVYVGQAHGPFLLACHAAKGYNPTSVTPDSPQCAGAAIYRANTGRAAIMPPGIHRLQPDTASVFASPAELVAHHTGCTTSQAEAALREVTPDHLLDAEVRRMLTHPNGRTYPQPKEGAN